MGRLKKKGDAGAAANYLTRNAAIKKLQISLAQFRRLCILKGIYPREPRNKKKVAKGSTAPKTFYFRKDIQFLLHEPILHKFREIRAHQLKINRAVGKREWAVVKVLDENRPEYRLDHIIKERYPSFALAVRDLDDALSMLAMFATLPAHSRVIKPSVIKNCARLVTEFQHYVMITGRLKKVFVSIKGIYYQADIGGSDVTWIVPHAFTQDTPRDVDFRIMATFLDLYENLVGFINYKLYMDLNFVYPPKMVDEEQSSGLAGLVVEPLEKSRSFLDSITAQEPLDKLETVGKKSRKELQKRLKQVTESISQTVSNTDNDETDLMDDVVNDEDDEDDDETAIPTAIVTPKDISETVPSIKDAPKISANSSRKLFQSCVFFLNREVPRSSLEFVIKSFGGSVGWPETSGSGSAVTVDDSTITHHIIDRPMSDADRKKNGINATREFVQPQWVYDCVNAGKLIKTKGYHLGETLPPHLSPFGGGKEGYVPPEASAFAVSSGVDAEEEASDEIDNEDVDGGEDEAGDEDEDEMKGPLDNDEDEEMYQAEIQAEAAGLSFTEYMEQKSLEKDTQKTSQQKGVSGKKRKVSTIEAEAAEEKELAKMMMSKKERRLYNQIEFGRNKKAAEAQKLKERRIAAEQQKKANKMSEETSGAAQSEAKKAASGTRKLRSAQLSKPGLSSGNAGKTKA
ncbi:mRNA-binding ribosome synthesis protein nop7 [Entophlyctis sp. JEL0112]|nr:mRNA-binding ribosome synthesis protein nop7 [Entophlyctis sp. JEL0112]